VLYCINQENIETYWEHAKPYVEKALKKTGADAEYKIDDIRNALIRGDMQLWIWADDGEILAVGVSEILCYPQMKILSVPFAGAEKMSIEAWFEGSLDELIRFAKAHGCKGIKGYGRYGWIKKFKKLGNVRSEASFILEI